MSKSNISKVVTSIVIVLLVLFLASCSTAAGSTSIELRWYQPEPEGHPWTDIGKEIVDEISKRSDGRIKIIQYPAGVLGSQREALNMLRSGSLALLTTGPGLFSSYYAPISVFSFPYLFNSPEHGYRVFDSPIGQKIFNDIILNASGIRTIDMWYFGLMSLTTGNIAAKTPNDLKGAKIRAATSSAMMLLVGSLGVNPVPVEFKELYMALQTGVVDGQLNPVGTIYAQKFYEVQKYLMLVNCSYHMGSVHVSEKIWQQLDEADQDLVKDVFREYRPKITEKIVSNENEKLEIMKKNGIKVIEPDLGAFKEFAINYGKDKLKDKPEWINLIEQIQAIN